MTQFDPFAGPAIRGTAPTTEHQREIWTASQLGEDASLAYNESIRVELRGVLDREALERAFAALLARHEVLGASISGDGMTLCLLEPPENRLTVTDLSALDPQAQTSNLEALYSSEVCTPFDLSAPGLFRAQLVVLSPTSAVFVFTAHHIICDGWSTGVLVGDLARLYTEELLGFEHGAPVSFTYSAYAKAEAARDAGERDADEQHFLRTLQGELPVLDLPIDHPRPNQRTFRSQREDFTLRPELVKRLRTTGASRKASLFATLLSGFSLTVARLANQEDVIIGVPFAGQSLGGHDDLVGHAVNMLPIRLLVLGNEPYPELLSRTRAALLDAQEHQGTTLGRLLERLPIVRHPSRPPLISVTFNLDKGVPAETLAFQGLDASLHTNPRTNENFELFVNAVELGDTVTLECQYKTDLFDAPTIRRFMAAYERVLESIVEQPEQRVGALALVPRADLEQLAQWNDTKESYPEGVSVDHLVAGVAAASPAKAACRFQGNTLSYGELLARADILAAHLRKAGVGPGKYVGVCLERSFDLLVSLLAVWRAGGAYVPLDPDYPAERLRMMVEDSSMVSLVTSHRLNGELKLGATSVILVDELDMSSPPPAPADMAERSAEDPAYVIFTSGSTGRPKGVVVPHRAVVNLLNSVRRRPGLNSQDVVLGITTLSFDIAVSEIWLPMVTGATIALTTRDVASDGQMLKELLEREQVSFIDATPATYRLLLGAGWQGSRHLKLICTGEPMPSDLCRQLLNCSRELWNGYGPTETTVWSTFWQASADFDRVLIGRPVDNTQVHVLDELGQPVPIGTTGELYLGGAGVSHGYLGRPDLTDERFVPDPFTPSEYPKGNPSARMYRTGDLGRYRSSGELECLGRTDHQVKLRGFRIELGEIESALATHERVSQAVVVLREDEPGDPKLVAYLVTEGDAIPVAELRSQLKSRLPDYMIPAVYVSLPELPLTPSGKIDRRALPSPQPGLAPAEGEFVAPRTESEKLLAALWGEVLRLGRVGIEDDFFALGGHSLLASQILSRLRRDHGVELSFRKFFEAPTIALLAPAVDEARSGGAPTRQPPRPRSKGEPVPLSVNQERQFLLEEMDPAQRIAHNLPAAWEFQGAVQLDVLQQSLDHLVARHETLRTTFDGDPGRPLQHVHPEMVLPIGFRDLRSLPAGDRRAAMMKDVEEVSHQPFDLAKGPLFKSILFQFEDERFVYFSLRHSIIWDGWSFDIFLSELAAGYGAFAAGRTPAVPELPISYGDYCIWQRSEVENEAMVARIAWWRKELANAPRDMDFPHDFPRRTQSTYAGGNAKLTLSKDYSKHLTAVAHQAGTTFFMALYAAYVATLHRYSGESELLVGLPVRGRYLPELEQLIGPFTNTIILRSAVDGNAPFLDHLKTVRDRSLEAFAHEETPLELLSTDLPPVRALFSFQDTRERPKLLGDFPIQQTDVEHPAAANDLMIWAVERHDKIIVIANYNAEIFQHASIERFLRGFQAVLDSILQDPKTRIRELSILANQDLEEQRRGEQAALAVDTRQTPSQILRARAEKTPDGIALALPEQRTFSELLSDVETAAARLRAEGLASGEVVLLDMTPGRDLVTAAFAVWWCGGIVCALPAGSPERFRLSFADGVQPALCVQESESSSKMPGAKRIAASALRSEAPAHCEPTSHETALLQPQLGLDGRLSFVKLSHDSLGRATAGLARELEGAGPGDLWLELEPLSPAFGCDLLLGPTMGRSVSTNAADSALDRLLDALETGKVGIASASSHLLTGALAETTDFPTDCLAWGSTTRQALDALASATSVHPCQMVSLGDAGPLLFGGRYDSRFGYQLGRLLSVATAVRTTSDTGAPLPPGVRGRLEVLVAGGPQLTGRTGRVAANGLVTLDPAGDAPLTVYGVAPGAVERALVELDAVSAAFVRLEPDGDNGFELVTYYVPAEGTSVTDSEIRAHLRQELPAGLVPRLFVSTLSLARDTTGKVKAESLSSPLQRAQRQRVLPRTPNEALVAKLVAELLPDAEVSVTDNFFDLGGHSLLCLRLVVNIEGETGIRLSPRVILLNTLAQVAHALESGQAEVAPSQVTSEGEPKPKQDSASPEPQRLTGRVLKGLRSLLKDGG